MSSWTPISLEQLRDEIASDESQMDPDLVRLWNLVRVDFVKWTQRPWGDRGNGFWVVGLIGSRVLYYNDIEEGFNWSTYTERGRIDEDGFEEDGLGLAINKLRQYIQQGGPWGDFEPPEPAPLADV